MEEVFCEVQTTSMRGTCLLPHLSRAPGLGGGSCYGYLAGHMGSRP